MSMNRATVSLVGLDTDWVRSQRFDLDFSCILAIDLDGVVHPEHHAVDEVFCDVGHLWGAIRSADPRGTLPIVLTSDWRLNHRLEGLRGHFPSQMRRQIVGVTPDLFDAGGSRQAEIEAWMSAHAPEGRWLAVDDRPRWFELDCPHLFVVPSRWEGGPGSLEAELARDLEARLVGFLGRPASPLGRSTP